MLNQEGNLIISGFKTEDETQINNIYSNSFDTVSRKSEDGWGCIRMVKNEAK
jgi:ribosomal protein L11 methylase PrmA